MSRILLLVIFLLWMVFTPHESTAGGWALAIIFLGVYALLVILMRAWSLLLARNLSGENFSRSLRRFNKVMLIARVMVPTWFAIALLLGWGSAVRGAIGFVSPTLALSQLLPLLIGTLPAFLTWTALWWSQYPADRSLREQNMIVHVEAGLPVYPSPGLKQYITSNLRLQVLFTVVPVLLIILLRDLAGGIISLATGQPIALDPSSNGDQWREIAINVGAVAIVFLFAPEILRRVLQTEPLPDSPLRRRLEAMCRRCGMRYRDILLWRTENNMGNAAVMGLVPQVRYILLSDLLLERMDDEQIEAVFAHEVGHVIHWHMVWFVLFFVIFFGVIQLLVMWFGKEIESIIHQTLGAGSGANDLATLLIVPFVAAIFLTLFGYISRRFERQADVYAARTMESTRGTGQSINVAAIDGFPDPADAGSDAKALNYAPNYAAVPLDPVVRSHVGPYGATVFASALQRVAMINNMPLNRKRARRAITFKRRVSLMIDDAVDALANWFHGSIATRMDYLHDLSADPARTGKFDRLMVMLYAGLLAAFGISAVSLAMTLIFNAQKATQAAGIGQ